MRYEDLNGHCRERIRERVSCKLRTLHPDQPVEAGIRDYIVGVIIITADKNNLIAAAKELHRIKQANPNTQGTFESAVAAVQGISSRFQTEISILHDLYQLQEEQADIMDIISHIESRLLEE